MAQVTDPTYISKQMFDGMVRSKLRKNPNDISVRDQARNLLFLFEESKARQEILADILTAAKKSKEDSASAIAELGFVMGLQYGFELAMTCPPEPER